MIRFSLVALAIVGLVFPGRSADFQTRQICAEKGRYAGWPTLTRLKSGKLVVVFSGDRLSHVCPWGKVQMITSEDQGETWSKPQTIVNDLVDDRDAGLVELPNGNLALFYFSSLAFAEPAYESYWRGHPDWREHLMKIGEDEARRQVGAWVRLSRDGGKTWSGRVSTEVQTPHGGVLLRDGRLLMLGLRIKEGSRRYFAAESADLGCSWRIVAELPLKGVEPHWSLGEPSLFEGLDGTLHGYFRYELGLGKMLYVKSCDGGKTWSDPVVSDIEGFPPHFVRLRDKRVVCSYGCRTKGRIGVYARISSDDGKIWGEEVTLARSTDRDLGYASTAELDDGSLLTVFYMHNGQDPQASIFATKWRPNESPALWYNTRILQGTRTDEEVSQCE